MALSATRLALATTLLLGTSTIGAQAGWFSASTKDEKPVAAAPAPGTNLETSI